MATGYLVGGLVAPLFNLGWNSPAGQMYSTVNDLFKVLCIYNVAIRPKIIHCMFI